MRGYYKDTIANVVGGNLVPLASVNVHVYFAGTTNHATIYGSRSPTDLTPLANPMTTGATGFIEFWAESGEYDIAIHDTITPARVGDKTWGWQALSGQDGGIPSGKLAADAALPLRALDAASMRQFVPLGTVIDWWRPNSSWDAGAGAGAPPPGFEVCDGHVVPDGSHDFGAGALTLPDLRNKFIIGADISAGKADGTGSVPGDGTAAYNAQHPNAPGIRGVGGTNATHTHTVPSHFHGKGTLAASGGSHAHTDSGHGHGASTDTQLANDFTLMQPGNSGIGSIWAATQAGQYFNVAYANNGNPWGAWYAGHGHGVTINPGAANIQPNTHSHPNSEFSGNVGNYPAGVNGDAQMTSGAIDGRPAHYGLLKIMKVRRS